MHIRTLAFFIKALALFASASAHAQTQGALLAYGCAGCHGTNGNSQGPATPSIAGMEPEYFTGRMQAFRDGERGATVMGRIASGYSEEEIRAMAEFFAGQPRVAIARAYDAAKVKAGGDMHRRFCQTCHGKEGRGADESAPLAGQPKLYLEWSLRDFTNGARKMPGKMRRELEKIYVRQGDDGFAALASFYASQAVRP